MIAEPILLELHPVSAVGVPAVALEHDRTVDHPEVDLMAVDDPMKLDGRQPMLGDERAHRRFQHTVSRLSVDHPVVESGPKGGYAMATSPGVHIDGGPQCHG